MKFAAVLFASLAALAQPPEVNRCAALRHHGDPDATKCYRELTKSNNPAVRAEGFWGIKDYKQANEEFLNAIKANSNDPAVWTRRGRMFLDDEQDNPGEWFQKAIEIQKDYAPAILGMALVAEGSFQGQAAELARTALKIDPKLSEAQELLARVALEDSNPEKAAEEAKKALEIDKESLGAMSILAIIDLLNDKKNTPWMDRIFKINPVYAEVYDTAAHFFFINRRYEEEIAAYRKALEIKPDFWHAKMGVGLNLMRFGKDEEARKELEECFNAGYYSVELRNSLKLLDKYKNYVTYKTPTTIIRLDKKEAGLLHPYFQQELDRAIATYQEKYHYKLNVPVQVEVFPDHEDFAVRTMGMPGLGALGVTFGTVIAMDSPSGRKPGEFHWASTMWHELSHAYVLTMTNSRVPRWFTEGLAVFEETANGHPDWGDRLDPEAIDAIKSKKLLPIADLDRGFIHPSYPAQVVVSYFQGGKICNFINDKWGYAKLLAMIDDFAKLTPTPAVIEKEFGMKPEEFDKQFLAWLDAQTGVTVKGFEEWREGLKSVAASQKEKNWDEVIAKSMKIRDLYTDYVEAGSVYEFLAEAYINKDQKDNAMAELERYSKVGGRNPSTLKRLAQLQTEAGKKDEAAKTLERLTLIYLKDEDEHKRLGDLYMDLNRPTLAIREFKAVVDVGPIDKAGAHYELARALESANRIDEAREEVFSSLEAAPSFKPAQKLLLELETKKPEKK